MLSCKSRWLHDTHKAQFVNRSHFACLTHRSINVVSVTKWRVTKWRGMKRMICSRWHFGIFPDGDLCTECSNDVRQSDKAEAKIKWKHFFIISYTLVRSGSIYFTNSSADISVWLLRVFGLSLFEILIYFAIISTAIPLLLLLLALRLPGLLIVLLIYSYYNFYCSNIYSHCFCYSYF